MKTLLNNIVKTVLFLLVGYSLTFILYPALLGAAAYGYCSGGIIKSRRHAHSVCSLWGRLVFQFTPGWKQNIEGPGLSDLLSGDERFIVVANHRSFADIAAIFLIPFQFRWLSKHSIFKIPFIGLAMKLAGYVSINKKSPQSAKRALAELRDRLMTHEASVLIFPEGTRGSAQKMLAFKPGAFALSLETNRRILPIVIQGTEHMIQKGWMAPAASCVRIQVLNPQASIEGETVTEFAGRIRDLMLEHLR